jgi:4-hydroxy-4-methyl-2-oxoglutarate aldolase
MPRCVILFSAYPISTELRTMAMLSEPATISHFRLMRFPNKTIRPACPVTRIVGQAVTLALPAADSTLLHHAVHMLRPDDVLVIDRLGDEHHACLGGGRARDCASGVAAVIIDGPIADPLERRELGLPVWASGVSSITTRLLDTGGLMNTAICCGGAVVGPGDLVIADEGGIGSCRSKKLALISSAPSSSIHGNHGLAATGLR